MAFLAPFFCLILQYQAERYVFPELPVKLSLDDTNDVFSRFSAYFEQQNRELINSTQNAIKLAIKGVNKPFFKNES